MVTTLTVWKEVGKPFPFSSAYDLLDQVKWLYTIWNNWSGLKIVHLVGSVQIYMLCDGNASGANYLRGQTDQESLQTYKKIHDVRDKSTDCKYSAYMVKFTSFSGDALPSGHAAKP
ncbi:hypothetical protein SELMODRAFT_410168 [Selaginella moellendorffii]|uniref:Uncharacterized protein n=2 Tax=Selaginella moellendorffii TaxID=88036 RepID=D8RDU8_SELML|nr:hypothetical protein SELMODRAFT_410166 [Selaginella moellendorffii]EFJ29563.1 hypothetical protein SELMODRAFT_410168 [Selaginella moellendorffii]